MKKILIFTSILFVSTASAYINRSTSLAHSICGIQQEQPCTAVVFTTSTPTIFIQDSVIQIDSPEVMLALLDGDTEVATEVAKHFDTTGTKILETVSVLDEAGVEITLENIGNNL